MSASSRRVSTFGLESGVPAQAAAATAPSWYGSGNFFAADHAGGYWTTNSAGALWALGGATNDGSLAGTKLNKPIVGIAGTPDGGGYWMVASDGGIFSFGDAHFYGSTGSLHLNQPIVGMASTSDGGGYWMVASDGGIFSFGDARFYGSTGSLHLNKAIVGMAGTPDGGGYWMVASDGGIFSFGDAALLRVDGLAAAREPDRLHDLLARWSAATGSWPPTAGCSATGMRPSTARSAGREQSRRASKRSSVQQGYQLVETEPGRAVVRTSGAGRHVDTTSSSPPSRLHDAFDDDAHHDPTGELEPLAQRGGTGVYAGGGDPQAVSDFASSVGAKPRYAMDFLDGTSWSTITQSGWPYSALGRARATR